MSVNQTFLRLEIRSVIFETSADNTSQEYEAILHRLSYRLKEVLNAAYSAVYTYDNWHDQYTLAASSSLENEILKKKIPNRRIKECKNKPVQILRCLDEEMTATLSDTTSSYLIPLKRKDSILGFLFLAFEKEKSISELESNLVPVAADLSQFLEGILKSSSMERKANKSEVLHQAAFKFHSSMEPKAVLYEINAVLNNVYPLFKFFSIWFRIFQMLKTCL